MASPAIQTFGKYQILERIATGGMAEIYKARLEGIGGFQRTFAIKRILPHLSQNAEYVAMLVDEAKVAGLLSHANIVQILDLGQVDGVWYIAMEYVNGRDLGAVLKRCRQRGLRLPVPHTVFIAIELLKGLEYAHQRQVMRGGRPIPLNIIHRDVSPPNVLLAFQGEVKLTDFGIARASLKVMETQAGVIKGRFDYMSPEQAAGSKDLDQRSDLFSVGVVLYEILTGKHPFRAESELTTLENVRLGKYEPISSLNPDVPFTLETIVDRALRVDREERYPSATAFKEALDKFFHDAGFIFTHSTLAAYIKGLFPEIEHGKSLSTATATPTPIFDQEDEDAFPTDAVTDEVELDPGAEGPTKVMDRRMVEREAARQAAVAESSADVGNFGLTEGDEATQIRKNPLQHASDQWDDAEQETVIRRAPLAPAETPHPLGSEPPTVVRGADDVKISEFSTVLRKRPGLPQSTERPAGGASFGRVAFLSVVVGLVLGSVGLAVGATVGVLATRALAPDAVPAVPELVTGSAKLRVYAPSEATVRVNGVHITDEVNPPPDEPVEVTVELEGYEPWREEVTVATGETRVFVITVHQLEPEQE